VITMRFEHVGRLVLPPLEDSDEDGW
jgi:hypothetical protein